MTHTEQEQNPLILEYNLAEIDNLPKSVTVFGMDIPIKESVSNTFKLLPTALSSMTDISHTCKQGELYEVIVNNKEEWLAQIDPDTGLLPGVVYDRGRIKEHTKLKPVQPDAFKALKVIGQQILLTKIALQVAEINTKLITIEHKIHHDRVSEIEGGINQMKAALYCEDINNRNLELSNAAQTLHSAITKNLRALCEEIKECSSPKTGFFDAWLSNGLNTAKRRMAAAQESAHLLRQGLIALYFCYIYKVPSETGALQIVSNLIADILKKVNFGSAHMKMSLIADTNLLFWQNLYEQLDDFQFKMKAFSKLDHQSMRILYSKVTSAIEA